MRLLMALVLLPVTVMGCGGSGLNPADRGTRPNDASPAVDAYPADTRLCDVNDKPICLTNCRDRFPDRDALCKNGVWVCPSGFKNSKTCPADACAITGYQCCNSVTGEVTQNPCPEDGELRPSCPEGSHGIHGSPCIPTILGVYDCADIEGTPCLGEAQSCRSMSRMGEAYCWCPPAPDAGTPIWQCSIWIP